MITLLNLFSSFFFIGLFSYGGGYVMIPLIEREIVVNHGWLVTEQFLDIIAIAEVTPGPITINSATYVGYSVAQLPGSIAATLGVVAPSLIIIMLIAYLCLRFEGAPQLKAMFTGIRPVVVVLIFTAAFTVGKNALTGYKSVVLALVALGLMQKTKISPILLLLASGIVGILVY